MSENPDAINLAIVGGRDFHDYELLKKTVAKVKSDIGSIVSGGANGADSLAERYAKEFGIPTQIFPADWKTHGKRAGFLRNTDIISASDAVIAFWDGKSAGTKSSIGLAEKMGKKLHVVKYEPLTTDHHYQRVRIDAQGKRYLQCHSKGAREYSPFNCYVQAFGEMKSIEDHYQCTKVFANLNTDEIVAPRDWKHAKELQNDTENWCRATFALPDGTNLGNSNSKVTDLVIQWYIALWYKYLLDNPQLVQSARGYDGYEDIFEGTFPFSQAKVIAQVVKHGDISLVKMFSGLTALLKETKKAPNRSLFH